MQQAHLRGEPPPWGVAGLGELVDEVGGSVREHMLLEREVTNYWLALYFRRAVAAQPRRTWPALLMHWIRQVRCCMRAHPAAVPGAPGLHGWWQTAFCCEEKKIGKPTACRALGWCCCMEQHADWRLRQPAQETGLAQVQLEEEGLETVVRIDRPAQVPGQPPCWSPTLPASHLACPAGTDNLMRSACKHACRVQSCAGWTRVRAAQAAWKGQCEGRI
jgi:hypothetical protein